MKRLTFTFLPLIFGLLIISSCTKNKLDEIRLSDNPFGKWSSEMPPIKITKAKLSTVFCRTQIVWSIDQEYRSLIPVNPSIKVVVTRDGVVKQRTGLKGGGTLNDSHCIKGTRYYAIIEFPDGSETRSLPVFSD